MSAPKAEDRRLVKFVPPQGTVAPFDQPMAVLWRSPYVVEKGGVRGRQVILLCDKGSPDRPPMTATSFLADDDYEKLPSGAVEA
jgi:hypothetical protein